jgi:hypothetical protein
MVDPSGDHWKELSGQSDLVQAINEEATLAGKLQDGEEL